MYELYSALARDVSRIGWWAGYAPVSGSRYCASTFGTGGRSLDMSLRYVVSK